MREVAKKIFSLFHIPLDTTEEERKQRLLHIMLLAVTLTGLLALLLIGLADVLHLVSGEPDVMVMYIGIGIALLSTLLVFIISRFAPSEARWLFVFILLVLAILSDSPRQTVNGRNLITFALPIVIAGLLLRPYMSFVVAGLGGLVIALVALYLGEAPNPGIAALFMVALTSAIVGHTLERIFTDLHAANRNLALLNRASHAFGSTLDMDQVLGAVLDEVRHLLNAVACSIWLLDRETGELVCRQATGPQSEIVRGWRLAAGEGLGGWAAEHGESLLVSNAQRDGRYFKGVDHETGLLLHSMLVVPLQVRQRVIGILQVVDTEIDRFQPGDLELLEPLTTTAAMAIENARLYAKEQQHVAILAQALEQQRELDRLKSEFIQNVSHELHTPLALIRGYAELLESGELGALRADQREPVSVIARRTRMLSKLVDNLTTAMVLDEIELVHEPVDLARLVRPLLADFQVAAERADLSLVSAIDPYLPLVMGDSDYLLRVLDNLLGNAMKFTPSGGSVAVRLRHVDAHVVVEVADTGIGIPEEQVERIFERFYQVDGSSTRRYGGTGLGLALVKEIVERHAGSVHVDSRLGKGSTFRVELPIAEEGL